MDPNKPPEVELIWGSSELVMRNPPQAVLSDLHYVRKKLEVNELKHKKEVTRERTPLYKEVEPGVYTTYQGMIDRVIATLKAGNIPYKLADCRAKLPVSQVHKAKGFRFGQRRLFLELLSHNRSGMLKAVTRYGKTTIMANVCRAYPGQRIVITAPGVSLLSQLVADLQAMMPEREIKGIFTGSKGKKASEDITVCSMDSLGKAAPEKVDLLLVDEPHSCVSPTRILDMVKFTKARVYGFGATLEGRFDGGDALITGIIGPVLTQVTMKEAVAEGAVCPIKVFMVKRRFSPFPAYTREIAYRTLMFRNQGFNENILRLSREVIPPDWQTMIFVDEIKQADLVGQLVEEGVVTVASKMTPEERKLKYEAMVNNTTKRCICTDIYATGITFPDLRVIINAAGGGGSITSTQKPGRLAQVRPGKKCGYLIDFMFTHTGEAFFKDNNEWQCVGRDCQSRIANYQKIGFEVVYVEKLSDIHLE